jgi:hypothetical protein
MQNDLLVRREFEQYMYDVTLFIDAQYRKKQMLQFADIRQRQIVPFDVTVVEVVRCHRVPSSLRDESRPVGPKDDPAPAARTF